MAADTINEERNEAMVPLTGGNPVFRKAHFIKPTTEAIKGPFSKLHSLCLSSVPVSFKPQKWVSNVKFQAWKCPLKNWAICVRKMAALHESTWKKAGIFEAIMNSTFEIRRNDDLVFGVAEKWLDETKSFVFSWGEASITLEDVMILGGYSVSGSPVYSVLDSENFKEKVKQLQKARRELGSPSETTNFVLWMNKFVFNRNEIQHEAFIAMWLLRYVFPSNHYGISESVFTISVQLARGTRIALAPAVLAGIYSDLRSLKQYIVTRTSNKDGLTSTTTRIDLWSPFQLVQVWIWERFIDLRPRPNVIQNGEPRMARWHSSKFECSNVRSVLDSSKGNFDWRPYTKSLANWKVPSFYGAKEIWISVGSCHGLDEMLSFVRCLRASELIGLQSVEIYLPHRVALQFGMDQDLPGCVDVTNENPDVVWGSSIKPVKDGRVYIPSRFREGDVTTRYLEWWKKSLLSLQVQSGSGSSDNAAKTCLGMREGESIWGYVARTKKLKRAKRSFPQVGSGSPSIKCLESSTQITRREEKDSSAAAASSSHKQNLKQKIGVHNGVPSKNLKVSGQSSKQKEDIGANMFLDCSSERLRGSLRCVEGKGKGVISGSPLDVRSKSLVRDFPVKRKENSDHASSKFPFRTMKEVVHNDRARKELDKSPLDVRSKSLVRDFPVKRRENSDPASSKFPFRTMKEVVHDDRARKELDESPIPLKSKIQQAKGSVDQDSAIVKEASSPFSRLGGDFEKPRFPESHSPESSDEDQLTVSEWFRTRNKSHKTESKEPESHSSGSANEDHQPTVSGMLRSRNKTGISECKDQGSRNNSSNQCQNLQLTSSAAKVRPSEASKVKDVTESVEHSSVTFNETLMISLDLEARMDKLERQVAEIKAARFGKVGPSN